MNEIKNDNIGGCKTDKEKQNIEWKSIWKDEYLEWICGYANSIGGKLYIGFDDNGNVIGIDNAEKLLDSRCTWYCGGCEFIYKGRARVYSN